MVCYFKRICGINQAEDRVTWPDLLHRHTHDRAREFLGMISCFRAAPNSGPTSKSLTIKLRPGPAYYVEVIIALALKKIQMQVGTNGKYVYTTHNIFANHIRYDCNSVTYRLQPTLISADEFELNPEWKHNHQISDHKQYWESSGNSTI